MTTANAKAYLRFLDLAKSIHSMVDDSRKMRANDRALLELLALAAIDDKPLTVTEAMRLRNLASPATLHRHIQHLVQLGMIEMKADSVDSRVRHLLLTTASRNYFELLGSALASAMKTEQDLHTTKKE